MDKTSTRKHEHLSLATQAQLEKGFIDNRFNYEPLFSAHPDSSADILKTNFLGKELSAPLWISSMTGGTGKARHINQNLARVTKEFGLGMGLGSCRPLLESDEYFEDFNLRPIIGDSLPFYANLGIAQLEQVTSAGKVNLIAEMLKKLQVNGLIVHINPLQEWYQPGGDRYRHSPLETIELLLEASIPLIVKEVGQGLGPKSLAKLMELPLMAIEFAAFGGTNFAKLEALRSGNTLKSKPIELCHVGHTAEQMVDHVNQIFPKMSSSQGCSEFIISGGVKTFLDGYYLTEKCLGHAIYGQAKSFLDHASDYDDLFDYVSNQIAGLKMAKSFLQVKRSED